MKGNLDVPVTKKVSSMGWRIVDWIAVMAGLCILWRHSRRLEDERPVGHS